MAFLMLAGGGIGCLMLFVAFRGKKQTQFPTHAIEPVRHAAIDDVVPVELVEVEPVQISSPIEDHREFVSLSQSSLESQTSTTPIQLDSSFIFEQPVDAMPHQDHDFVLSSSQIKTVLDIAGLVPDQASPLVQRQTLSFEEQPNIDALIRQGIVIRDGENLHVDAVHRAGFLPICHPDEFVELQSSETPGSRFFAKKLAQITELTDLPGGKMRVAFPSDEGEMTGEIRSYFEASRNEESQRRTQFLFTGSPAEVVVLSLVTREALGRRPVNLVELNTLVVQALKAPEMLYPFVASAMKLNQAELKLVEQAVPLVLRSLVDRRYLKFENERFYPVNNVGHTFAGHADREMTIKRTLRSDAGFVSQQVGAVRISQSLIVMSSTQFPDSKEGQIDWRAIAPETFADYLSLSLKWRLP